MWLRSVCLNVLLLLFVLVIRHQRLPPIQTRTAPLCQSIRQRHRLLTLYSLMTRVWFDLCRTRPRHSCTDQTNKQQQLLIRHTDAAAEGVSVCPLIFSTTFNPIDLTFDVSKKISSLVFSYLRMNLLHLQSTMLHHHVSTEAQNGQTRHWPLRGPSTFFTGFTATTGSLLVKGCLATSEYPSVICNLTTKCH